MSSQTTNKSKSSKSFWPVLIILIIAGLVGGYLLSTRMSTGKSGSVIDATSIKGGETRPTLSPARFTGKTSSAYVVAKEIPEILDHIYCYCDCKIHFNHKSLLTCYTDEHAVHCDVCQDEAIRAYELHKQGKDAVTIRKIIDKEFSH